MKLRKLKKWLGNLPIFSFRQRTFSADTMEELEQIWQNDLMNNGWDVKKPLDVRWSWRKFNYEYYFIAKYVA